MSQIRTRSWLRQGKKSRLSSFREKGSNKGVPGANIEIVMNTYMNAVNPEILLACMYEYIQRLPFVELPMKSGVQLGLGEGSIKSGSNVPTPWVPSVPRHARWHVLTHYCVFSEPTLLQAAKGDLFPHIGGAVSHRVSAGMQFTRTGVLFLTLFGPIRKSSRFLVTSSSLPGYFKAEI